MRIAFINHLYVEPWLLRAKTKTFQCHNCNPSFVITKVCSHQFSSSSTIHGHGFYSQPVHRCLQNIFFARRLTKCNTVQSHAPADRVPPAESVAKLNGQRPQDSQT